MLGHRRQVLPYVVITLVLVCIWLNTPGPNPEINRKLPYKVHLYNQLHLIALRRGVHQQVARPLETVSWSDGVDRGLSSVAAQVEPPVGGEQAVDEAHYHSVGPHLHQDILTNNSQLTCDSFNRTTFHTEYFCLYDGDNLIEKWFRRSKYGPCYVHGAELVTRKRRCFCRLGWYGASCSTPHLVEISDYPYEYGPKVRESPARVIYAFPFLSEFEMLEARFHELGDLVDLFIIVESNFTASGKPKPKSLLDKLKQGYLAQYHEKIFHLSLDYFPPEAYEDGWVIDELLRHYISLRGLSAIKNLRDDDIFVLTDSDEIPVWETIFYLKIHIGFTQPVAFHLKHNVYGFFWQGPDLSSRVFGACTIHMLRNLFNDNPYHLRSASRYMLQNEATRDNFKYRLGGRVQEWTFGTADHCAGWHCSWCFTPHGIRQKMLAAHSGDKPRWGDNPHKTDVGYIMGLVERGVWFDDKLQLLAVNYTEEDRGYAPSYLLEHPTLAQHLLQRPTHNARSPVNSQTGHNNDGPPHATLSDQHNDPPPPQ